MAYDISALTPKEQITALYVAYYDRAPDPGGLTFWTARLNESLDGDSDGDAGLTLTEIANRFAASAESQAVYPDFLGDSDGDGVADGNNSGVFVTQVYINLFGRLPDEGGLNHWTKNIDNGNISPGEALLKIMAGAQGSDITILENKIDVAGDWTQSAIDDNVLNLSPADAAEARSILDGVDATQASVDDAKAETDAYFNDAPVANDDTATTDEDNSINGDVGDDASDADGDALTFSVESGDEPENGTVTMNADGTYTYTPNADFNGTDSFTYTVSDGIESDMATVTVTVNAVNDAPVAQAETESVTEDGPVINGQLDATDVENDNLSYSVQGTAPAGLTVFTNGSYTFDPSDAAYQGLKAGEQQVVNATYIVNDGNGGTDTGAITITVTGTNDAPVAEEVTVSGVRDTDTAGLVTATDVDGDNLTFSVEAGDGPSSGSVVMNPNGSFVYTPNAGFSGPDSFTYTVSDGQGGTVTETVTVNVAASTAQLSPDIDIIEAAPESSIVVGNENTLTSGDVINGGGGSDTLIVNVNNTTGAPLTFSAFEANVETFQTTIDGNAGAVFDMSSSEITGNTFINANSRQDATYHRVNMNPDGDDADSRPQLDVELRNVTQGASTTFTTRPAQVVGPNDEANVLLINIDNNAQIGALSFYGTPGNTDASGLEVIDISTAGSPLKAFLNALNTPGANTVNIAADPSGLRIGDIDNNVTVDTAGGASNDSDVGVSGFENPLSASVLTVNASASTGGVELSLQAANGDTNVQGGAGNDILVGSDNNNSGRDDFIRGNGGNDTIDGGLGDDSLLGDAGNDLLIGGGANDTVAPGNDTLVGGDGNDTLLGENGEDDLLGGAGNDFIDTGSLSQGTQFDNEFVDAGSGNDTVNTRGEHLEGGGNEALPVFGFDDGADRLIGGDDIDTLNVFGDSGHTDGLDNVSEFENIFLQNNVFTYTIGNGSWFEFDHDARVDAGGADGSTTIDGTSSSNTNIDATTLNEAITLIGGDGADVLRGGRGNDLIIGDGDLSGSGGDDTLEGGAGDDTFRMGESQLDSSDFIEGDQGFDTIEIVNRSNVGSAEIGSGVAGIELLKVIDDAGSQGQSFDLSFQGFDNNDNLFLAHDGVGANQNGPRLHVDGSELDLGEELNVDMSNNGFDEDIQITGGGGDDTFNMGLWFDSGDEIDGGDDSGNSDTLIVDIAMLGGLNDDDFANTSNVETLVLVDPSNSGATVNLGALAAAAGIKTVDASALTVNGTTINATAFPNDLTVIDSNADLNINTGGGNDTIVLAGGTDNINTGGGNDIIEVENGDLDFTDVINGGSGDDSVKLMNQTGPSAGIGVNVDLDTVLSIESYIFEGNGDRLVGLNDFDTHSITFRGGNVGTVTPILIDGSNVTDPQDTLNVTIAGDGLPGGVEDVDADFFFTVIGTEGTDNFVKNNFGFNNNIDWNGGLGNDSFSIGDGDLGASTTVNGGSGTDTLFQLQGAFIDDDFINVSSMEVLDTSSGQLLATLGAEADEAGIVTINGGANNDNVVLDPAFNNALDITPGTGDDVFNAGASSSQVDFLFPDAAQLTAADTLTGGTGTGDTLNLLFNTDGETADASGVNGVEIINLGETGATSNTYNLILGNTVNDNANNLLTINEGPYISGFDGETMNVNGAAYTGDIVYNGEGNSAVSNVTTGTGNDTVNGGSLGDTLITGDGNDVVNGESGDDTIDAGAGNDIVNGGSGDDVLAGGAGDDTIDGGSGNDVITGGADDDPLNPGGDVLSGGGGNDAFRYVNFTESNGLNHDLITDFVAEGAEKDTIQLETNVLVNAVGASGPVTDIKFAGNAASFGQAQSAIGGLNANDGFADYVFQTADGADPAGVWVDVNDDGVLNNLDMFIEMTDASGPFDGDEVELIDTIPPAAPTIDSIADDTGALGNDFITQDGTLVVTIGLPTGAGDGTDAKAGDTLRIFHPTIAGGVTDIALTPADIAAGEFAFDITGIPLPDGSYDFSAQIIDNFDPLNPQAGAISDVQPIIVDTFTTIDLDFVAGDNVDDGIVPDYMNSSEITNVISSGTTDAEEGQTVTVSYTDGVTTINDNSAIVDGSGNWVTTGVDLSGLTEGNITVEASVTDLAGNANSDSDTSVKDTLASVTIDTSTALADGVLTAAELAALTVNGTTANVENTNTVTYSISDGVTSAGETVNIVADAWTGSGSFGPFVLDTITGAIDFSGEIDTVSFDLVAGETYTFDYRGSATGGGTLFDPEFSLVDEDGVEVAQDDDSGTGFDAQIVYTPATSGTFTAFLGEFPFTFPGPTGTDTGSYTLDVTTTGLSGVLNDGAATVTATTTDDAGNVATNTVNVVIDTTGPQLDVDFATWDSDNQTLTLNGTFNAAELNANIGTFDATQVVVDGIALTGATTVSGPISGTQIVLDISGDQAALAGTWGDGTGDDVDLNAGVFADAVGNLSNSDLDNETQFLARSSDLGPTTMVGQSQDDTFELDDAGQTATGGGGADTFIITEDGGNAYAVGVIGTITDFDASEGDLIQFDAAQLNAFGGVPFGNAFDPGDDGSEVAFRQFIENGNAPNDNTDAVAATTQAGTIIYDGVNERLLIDVNGDTAFNGFSVNNDADDVVVDLTGINGVVSASDIGFI